MQSLWESILDGHALRQHLCLVVFFLTNRRLLPRRFRRIHDGSRTAAEADTQSRHTIPPSFCTSHWLSQLLPT